MENLLGNIELYLKASIIMSFVAAFMGGLLVSFTPCVYPMIPITASFVGSRNVGGSKLKGFLLSLFYVIGVAVTYSTLGVFAAITGRLFGQISTNPYAYFILANIVIVLGLAMLDVFQIPVFAPKKEIKRGGYVGIFIIGLCSGFIAGPCTTPVLGVLLAYVASTKNILLGGSLLFVFAFGMSILLIMIGTFSGVLATLPKSGEWMVKIKKVLGILMIGLGEYFLIKMGQLLF
ncbi:MAG: cytochrome c biogenesis protein CcdA [Thermodesulfobacteriota bacterium]|nr:cytochrome c biogenesis protein CcdA [Thermodesulfobacteriota bacterium]